MSLGQKVISSLKWMAVFKFSGQLLNWAITIVVIRLLTPEDYGLMSQAMILIGLLALINEMGMGAALIQRQELDKQLSSQVMALALLINFFIFVLLLLLSPLVASFFGEPDLVEIIVILGIGFLCQSFAVIPSAILSRRMEFKKKALVDLLTMVSSSVVTLVLALQSFGVWALVTGHLVGIFVRVVGVNIASKYWILPSFKLAGLKRVFQFGGTVTLERVLWYLYSQADMIIVGRFLGKESLGFYSVAMQLATLPMQKIAGMMNDVGFAAFSRLQDQVDEFRAHFIKAAKMVCAFAFPVFWGMSSITPEIVEIFLGEKWRQVILPMQLLCLVIPIRMLSTIASPALTGKGRPDVSLKNLLIAFFLMPTAFLIGIQWGLVGVAYAWLIAYPITFIIMQKHALKAIEVPVKPYLKEVSRPVIPGILMLLTVYSMRELLAGVDVNDIVALCLLIGSGAVSYLVAIYLLQRELLIEIVSMVKR